MRRINSPRCAFSVYGEEYKLTDYIQVENPQLIDLANSIRENSLMDTVKIIAQFVAKKIKYPLNCRGEPNVEQKVSAFKVMTNVYLYETPAKAQAYSWRFPNQTLICGFGACFDSSVVTTTLLRLKGIESKTVLGAIVKSKEDKFLGFHAWTEFNNEKGEVNVIETTSHPNPAEYMSADSVYNGRLQLKYCPIIRFDEREVEQDDDLYKKYGSVCEGEVK